MSDANEKELKELSKRERSALLLEKAEKELGAGNLEIARDCLEQCAELTRHRNPEVLKLLSKVYSLLGYKDFAANLWLQAAHTALLDSQIEEASRAFVKAFQPELLEDERWFRSSIYPFARNVLHEIASKLAASSANSNGSDTVLLLSSEKHSAHYLRTLKALLKGEQKNAMSLVALFSEADEQYMDYGAREAIADLTKAATAIIRPKGETNSLERLRFGLEKALNAERMVSEQSLLAPEGLILSVAASLRKVEVVGACFNGIPVFDGVASIVTNERIAEYSPVPATVVLPPLKSEDPRYISARNKTGSDKNVTLWTSKKYQFTQTWWTTLKVLIEASEGLQFVICHPPGESESIPEFVRSFTRNVHIHETKSLAAIPYASNVFLLLPDCSVPATILADCFGAGVPAVFLTRNSSRHALPYASLASEACMVFKETEREGFSSAFKAHTASSSEQQRFSLLASTKATRCSLKATDTKLAEMMRNKPSAAGLPKKQEKTPGESLAFSIEDAPPIPPETIPQEHDQKESSAEKPVQPKSRPAVTALFTEDFSPRLSEYLRATKIPALQHPLAILATRCSTTYPDGPHLFFPDEEEGSKYPGETERALIDFLRGDYKTTHLFFAGLSRMERMAEFNARVLRVKYSVLLLDSDTALLPTDEAYIDNLQRFLSAADTIYLSDLQASRWLEIIGIDKKRTKGVSVDLSVQAGTDKLSDNLAVGVIAAVDKLVDLAAVRSVVAAPHTFHLYSFGPPEETESLPVTINPADIANVDHAELQDLDLVVIAAGDREPIDAALPSLEFFLKQISAAGAAIITNCTKVISTCELIKSNAPVTVFTSVKQLEKQIAALLADPDSLRDLSEQQRKSLFVEQPETRTNSNKDTKASLSDSVRGLIGEREFTRANELLVEALANDPDNLGLLILRAEVLLGLGQKGGATQTINKVLTSFPEHPKARELLRVIEQTPEGAEAKDPVLEVATNAEKEDANGQESHSALIDSVLSLLQTGAVAEAKDLLQTHKPEPIPQDYFYTLALCFAKEGDYEKSMQAALEELELFPENTAARELSKSLDEILR